MLPLKITRNANHKHRSELLLHIGLKLKQTKIRFDVPPFFYYSFFSFFVCFFLLHTNFMLFTSYTPIKKHTHTTTKTTQVMQLQRALHAPSNEGGTNVAGNSSASSTERAKKVSSMCTTPAHTHSEFGVFVFFHNLFDWLLCLRCHGFRAQNVYLFFAGMIIVEGVGGSGVIGISAS